MTGDAIRRIEDEVGQRPLLTLAIAAGIGFLAGMAGRRQLNRDAERGSTMSIQATVMHAVRGFLDSVKRSAIAYSICALCGLAMLILATGAAVMALIPLVGAVYAQLIVAGVFLAGDRRDAVLAAAPGARAGARGAGRRDRRGRRSGQAQFAQIAMIIEALMLGYSMSRRRR